MGKPLATIHPRDLTSDREARWCPGCGDFAILAQLKHVLSSHGLPRESLAIISGSGCASRLPHYVNAYGFQTLAGCAPPTATGLKVARPDLQVWVIVGDGESLSGGAGHLLHALRRNVDLKILLLNNEVRARTKGHYSPASRPGTRTGSSPKGSFEAALRPLPLALAAEATFAARTLDTDVGHMTQTLQRAARHVGTAFVEIYQNCKVFNDGVFDYATDTSVKAEYSIYLEHGQPIVFGKGRDRALAWSEGRIEVIPCGNDAGYGQALIHDESLEDSTLAFSLSKLQFPQMPECFGVFRRLSRPTFEAQLRESGAEAEVGSEPQTLQALLKGDDAWEIIEAPSQ